MYKVYSCIMDQEDFFILALDKTKYVIEQKEKLTCISICIHKKLFLLGACDQIGTIHMNI